MQAATKSHQHFRAFETCKYIRVRHRLYSQNNLGLVFYANKIERVFVRRVGSADDVRLDAIGNELPERSIDSYDWKFPLNRL
ncbi:MAG: hypothetical protein ACD_39C00657G0001 [uncultured bacterium]|nr:MAG: hypothetical protein ACD_39C00657G0001 [uncultured bacterium]